MEQEDARETLSEIDADNLLSSLEPIQLLVPNCIYIYIYIYRKRVCTPLYFVKNMERQESLESMGSLESLEGLESWRAWRTRRAWRAQIAWEGRINMA